MNLIKNTLGLANLTSLVKMSKLIETIGDNKLYVTGHKITDVDSYVSSLILEGLLIRMGVKAEAVILIPFEKIDKNTRSIIKFLDLRELKSVEPVDDMKWFLVDHTSPAESIGMDLKDSVLGIIDHHRDTDICSPIMKIIDTIGSTTHVLFKFSEFTGYRISKRTKFNVLISLLVDTNCLTSSKATDVDKVFVKENMEEYKYTTEELFDLTVFDTDMSLSLEELALNGLKTQEVCGVKYSSSYLEFKKSDKTKEDKLKEVCEYMNVNTTQKLHYFLVSNMEKRTTTVTFFGEMAFKYPDVFENIEYDFIASRGAMVEPIVRTKIKSIIEKR